MGKQNAGVNPFTTVNHFNRLTITNLPPSTSEHASRTTLATLPSAPNEKFAVPVGAHCVRPSGIKNRNPGRTPSAPYIFPTNSGTPHLRSLKVLAAVFPGRYYCEVFMRYKHFLPITALFILYSLGSAIPQTKQLEEIHEEIQVDLVNVFLTALDSNDKFVTDLRPEELILKEDGVLQTISNFALASRTAEPLTVVVLIDTSLSMNEEFQNLKKIEMAKKGAQSLLNQLKDKDRMLLIRFSDMPLPPSGFYFGKNTMKEAIHSIKTDNGLTALLDAIELATQRLKEEGGQKLLFICSDGEDTASKHTKEEIFQSLRDSFDLTVVTLGINAFRANPDSKEGQTLRDGRTLLQSIADNTGGYAFFPGDLEELEGVMEKLKSLIGSQYSLGYHPTGSRPDGSWNQIEVSCSRPGVKLNYRPGYFSK